MFGLILPYTSFLYLGNCMAYLLPFIVWIDQWSWKKHVYKKSGISFPTKMWTMPLLVVWTMKYEHYNRTIKFDWIPYTSLNIIYLYNFKWCWKFRPSQTELLPIFKLTGLKQLIQHFNNYERWIHGLRCSDTGTIQEQWWMLQSFQD